MIVDVTGGRESKDGASKEEATHAGSDSRACAAVKRQTVAVVTEIVRRWTDEQLRTAVAGSFTIAQALRALGLIAAGGNYRAIQRRIAELELATNHSRGQGWSKGVRLQRRPLADALVAGRPTGSHQLKRRLFREGLKQAQCERCGWAERAADGRVPVELDHINGDTSDNRIENLRILCPNCHALQPTHRGLNQKRRRS